MESRKLITATDTQYSGSLLTSLNEQRIHGIFCDVTVIVEDKKFKAHRNILSASSTYFHQLFSVAGQVVELSFVRAEIFAEILNYIYSSKIVGVRTDMLDELIKSGQSLGVKFIAHLGVPLSHMKSMASAVKDSCVKAPSSDLEQKGLDIEKTATEQPTKWALNKDNNTSATPVITEPVAVSSKELYKSKKAPHGKDIGGDSDDDVVFCSEIMPPKPRVSKNPELARQKTSPDTSELLNKQMSVLSSISDHSPPIVKATSPTPNNVPLKEVPPSQTSSSPVNVSDSSHVPATEDVVLSPELLPPETGISDNPEVSQTLTSPDKVELSNQQMSVNSSITAQTPCISKAVSANNIPLKGATASEANSLSPTISNTSPKQVDNVVSSSELLLPKPLVSSNTEKVQENSPPNIAQLPTEQMSVNGSISAQTPFLPKEKSPNNLTLNGSMPVERNALSVTISSPSEAQASCATKASGETIGPSQNPSIPKTMLLNPDASGTTIGPSQNPSVPKTMLLNPNASGETIGPSQNPLIPKTMLLNPNASGTMIGPSQNPLIPKTMFLNPNASGATIEPSQNPLIPKTVLLNPHTSSATIGPSQNPLIPKTMLLNPNAGCATIGPSQNPLIHKTMLLNPNTSGTMFGPLQNPLIPKTMLLNPKASGANIGPSQSPFIPKTMYLNPYQSNCYSASVGSYPQNPLSPPPPAIHLLMQQQLPSINTFVNKPVVINSSSWGSNLLPNSLSHRANTEKAPTFDGPRMQNPQVATFSQKTMSKSGELKIKIADVNPGSSKDCSGGSGSGSQHIMDGKKIITLDTPSEIGGLSTGCKVYANIGEDTYDIVIPIKGDPDEDDGAVELPRSADGSPDSKRVKLKHEDHYELNVDGKTYYICIVCKRSYVSRTSLRRHYNVHSWEKKYPCHFCDKVYALAEYRTKHEVMHTGEKRYQCLTCGETFLNHKVMSSHIKVVHGQDPCADPKLYRLHPLKTSQTKQQVDNAKAHSSSSSPSAPAAPVANDEIIHNVDEKEGTASEGTESCAPAKPMNWEDVFVQPGEKAVVKENPPQSSTEFEFVIPESY